MNDKDQACDSNKHNPEDWADYFENNADCNAEFKRLFDDKDIKEVNNPTQVVLEDTYPNVELTIPRDGDGHAYGRVTKRLRDTNIIPIGTAHDSPILDCRVYEVEYQDGYKAALVANVISIHMFAKVDSEENRHVMID